MALSAGTAFVDIKPDVSDFGSALTREVTRGTAGVGTALERGVNRPLDSLRGRIGALGALIGSAVLVGGLHKIVSETIEWGEGVKTLTRNLGISTQSASGLALEAEHFGLNVGQLSLGLGIFEKHLVANDTASRKLGISFRDAKGNLLPFDQTLAKTSAIFQKMPDGPQKTALALTLFGRAGKQLIPFLNAGPAGMKKFSDEAKKLGLSLSGADLQAITKYQFATRDFTATLHGLETQIGLKLLPILTTFTHVITAGVQVIGKIPTPVLLGVAAFLSLAGAVKGVSAAVGFFSGIYNDVKSAITSIGGALTASTAATEINTTALETQITATKQAANAAGQLSLADQKLLASQLALFEVGGGLATDETANALALDAVTEASSGAASAQAKLAGVAAALGISEAEAAAALAGSAAEEELAALGASGLAAAQEGVSASANDVAASTSLMQAVLGPVGVALSIVGGIVALFGLAHHKAKVDVDAFTQAIKDEAAGIHDAIGTQIIATLGKDFPKILHELQLLGSDATRTIVASVKDGTRVSGAAFLDFGLDAVRAGKATSIAITEAGSTITEYTARVVRAGGAAFDQEISNLKKSGVVFVTLYDAHRNIIISSNDIANATHAVTKALGINRQALIDQQTALAATGADAKSKIEGQYAATIELTGVLDKLIQRGLPQRLADQLKAMGNDGLAAAEQLKAGTDDDIRSFALLAEAAADPIGQLNRTNQATIDLNNTLEAVVAQGVPRDLAEQLKTIPGALEEMLGATPEVQANFIKIANAALAATRPLAQFANTTRDAFMAWAAGLADNLDLVSSDLGSLAQSLATTTIAKAMTSASDAVTRSRTAESVAADRLALFEAKLHTKKVITAADLIRERQLQDALAAAQGKSRRAQDGLTAAQGKASKSAAAVLKAFSDELKAQQDYNKNFENLLHRNLPEKLSGQYADFIKHVADLGPAGAGLLAALASANTTQFNAIIAKWEQAQVAAGNLSADIGKFGDSWQDLNRTTNAYDIVLGNTTRALTIHETKVGSVASATRTLIGNISKEIGVLVTAGNVTGIDAQKKQELINKLRALEQRFPGLKTQIDGFITKISSIPPTHVTQLKVKEPSKKQVDIAINNVLRHLDTRFDKAGGIPLTITPQLASTDIHVDATNVYITGAAHAAGGAFKPYEPFIANEKGPEAFVFSRPGYVLSHEEASQIYDRAVRDRSGTAIALPAAESARPSGNTWNVTIINPEAEPAGESLLYARRYVQSTERG